MALTLKSQRQVQTDILNAIISRLGLTDVNPGSVLDLLTQSIAQEDFNQYVQMSQIVRLVDLDSTTGTDLENRAFEYGLTRLAAQNATGQVDITRQVDGANYTKVSTTFVSAGVLAPSIGDGIVGRPLNVNDASMFGSGTNFVVVPGDQIVIGRGLSNEETLNLTTVTQVGNTYQLIVSPALSNNHSFTEEITFIPSTQAAAGNIVISAGTAVSVPASGTSAVIDFQTLNDQTLFPGDATVSNVDVRALLPGANGNVGTGTVNIIDFVGLSVTNASSYTTGTDLQTDESLRDSIRSHIQSLSRGTQQAVQNAIVGVVDPSTSKRVISANTILPQDTNNPVRVYIDDGTGFEPSFLPQPFETVVDDASEGTTRLQLDFAPLVKASIESANSEPFDLSAITSAPSETGLRLTVRVGAIEETISLLLSDIEFPSTVRAEEIVQVINNKSTIAESRTSESGTRIVITGRADVNEDIFVDRPSTVPTTEDLNTYVQFTNNQQSTLYLYKDDKLLNKDGTTAAITNGGTATTFTFGSSTSKLALILDGKNLNPQTVTFDPTADITRLTGSVSPATVAEIINEQIAGAIAVTLSNDGKLSISTLTTLSAAGSVAIGTPVLAAGELNANTAGPTFNFRNSVGGDAFITPDVGTTRDYTLNRELGTIELSTALTTGEDITAGNAFSRGSLRTPIAVSSSTRINSGVGFNLVFDGSVTQQVRFTDNRFSALYLDDDMASNTLYNFDKNATVALTNGVPLLIVEYINKQIYPSGKATLRTINNESFIEITTNTFSSNQVISSETITSNGSIQFQLESGQELGIWQGTSTALVNNERPHQAFRENESTQPVTAGFEFSPTDTLIAVLNNDQTNGTFVLPLGYIDTIQLRSDADNSTTPAGGSTNSFIGDAIQVEFTSALFDSDSDYKPIPMTPIGAQGEGKGEIPADIDLRNFYLAMLGRTENSDQSTTNLESIKNRNSVITSSLNSFDLTFNKSLLTGFSLDAANDIVVGTTITVTGGGANAGTSVILTAAANQSGLSFQVVAGDATTTAANIVTALSTDSQFGNYIYSDAITVFVQPNVPSGTGTPLTFTTINASSAIGFQGTDLIIGTFASVDRDASGIGQVVFNSDTSLAVYSIGAGAGNQFKIGDFAIAQIAAGDIVTFSAMTNSVNDGTFIISAIDDAATPPTITVRNTSGVSESGSAGIAVMGQRRRVTAMQFQDATPGFTGSLTVGTAFRDQVVSNFDSAGADDPLSQYALMPSTLENLVTIFNNTRLSSISLSGDISISTSTPAGGSLENRLQISSLMQGSSGYVEVTGGIGNGLLTFPTPSYRGLQGYNYYTGLLELVHRTIYGDDRDLVTFPGVGAAGIQFQILAPTVTELILELDVTLQEGISIAAVENEVNTALTGYVNGLGVGDDVIVEELRARTIRINGITDVVITRLVGGTSTTSVANIAIADNEIARIRTSNITLG